MKVFCIGYNKTGTTSLTKFMRLNEFLLAPQKPFEYNLNSYVYGNSSTFIKMIKNDYYLYNFFQDVPFSLPNFYKDLDREFENGKFILTVRNDVDQWYKSLISYHKYMFGDLRNPSSISYLYEGWVYQLLTKVYGCPTYDPYNEQILKKSYIDHIQNVKEYFSNKPNKLLVLNLETDTPKKLESFLDIPLSDESFPHINKSN